MLDCCGREARLLLLLRLWRTRRTDFSYMHKWNSIDIFSFNMVMFPVNLNYHWSLIVLENPVALLQPKGSGRCRLLYSDSLRTWDSQISQLFTQWITWMRMQHTASPASELTPLPNFAVAMLDGPKQVSFLTSLPLCSTT
jgi:Ulp1 protease family, C-terminal catalytic domain